MNITTIIPVHKYSDEIQEYLIKAVDSVVEQNKITGKPKLLIVYSPEIKKEMAVFSETVLKERQEKLDFECVKNTETTNFQGQINFGVKRIKTDYFSILEFDDEQGNVYLKNAIEHYEAYPEVGVFLPIVIEINDKNEGLKLTNVITWSKEFVGENGKMGHLNIDMLKQYSDFKLCGAIIKKLDFQRVGALKTKIKLTDTYEYLLRSVNNNVDIMTMPKIIYKHLTSRKESLFNFYSKDMSMPERKFWFDIASVEYNFTNDRDIDMSKLNPEKK